MSITITSHQLGRLIARTADHIGDDLTPALHGIRLDADTEYLYAVATDRFTIAAARYRHHKPDSENTAPAAPFARTIPATALPALREWIRTMPGHDPVTVTPADDRIRFAAPTGELAITIDPDAEFADWRGLLRGVTEQTPNTGEPVFPALGTRLQARWQSADGVVRVRATGDHQPVLVVGEDFLGAQMPTRTRRDGFSTDTDTLATLDDVRTAWQDAFSTGPAITPQTALPSPPQLRDEASKTISEVAEDLLKQALHSTRLLTAVDTSEATAALATAGVTAWAAYRYLDALHTADPHLAATVVAETAEELDDGAISEWAWDAARAAGHDPQQWQTELQERQARKQAAA
ncbi:hypothetical protein OG195_44790 (plasmid) [Streptomyces sp. NBC_01362]|uniref:hypothetical protein n=1 Tax=Streptomyces sp. NBC_01362 TaxID=2903839 RepID=UPI002E364BC7|nr:hypothetical protein [Streptomyces sp. NBC_01362]